MEFLATYRKDISYLVGDEPYRSQAGIATRILIAPSQAQAEVNARRIAADNGWCLLDVIERVEVPTVRLAASEEEYR